MEQIPRRLTGKVVVVTGASQGIGAETVKAFRTLNYRTNGQGWQDAQANDKDFVVIFGHIASAGDGLMVVFPMPSPGSAEATRSDGCDVRPLGSAPSSRAC